MTRIATRPCPYRESEMLRQNLRWASLVLDTVIQL